MSSGGAFRSSGLMKRVQLDSNSALLSSPLRLFLRSLLPSFILCSSVDLFQLIRSSSLPWGHMCSAVIPAIAFCFTNLHIFILLAALAAPGATQLWIKEARWPPVTDHYEGNNHQIHKKQQAHIQDRHMVSVLTDAHGGFEKKKRLHLFLCPSNSGKRTERTTLSCQDEVSLWKLTWILPLTIRETGCVTQFCTFVIPGNS